MLFSPNNLYAWEKVPVPDYVDKKTKSPWNFYDDFENQKVGKAKLGRYRINDKGAGRKPFKIKQDPNGNKFIEVTVKHGWNKCCGSWVNTERAEFEAKKKRTLNKEIWYGFKMRLPTDFKYINDRVLITQFKNQFDPMKKSPLLGIRMYQNGNLLSLGGDTGGNAATKWNDKEYKKYSIRMIYLKKDMDWILHEAKKRGTDKIKLWKCNQKKPPEYCNEFGKSKRIKVSKLGEWTTYKIGIKNSKKKDGFVKVYKNDQLLMNYSGITFDWKGSYTGSLIRIGVYRDSDPSGKGYPPQSIHYDDFTIVSDKKTLDKYLN